MKRSLALTTLLTISMCSCGAEGGGGGESIEMSLVEASGTAMSNSGKIAREAPLPTPIDSDLDGDAEIRKEREVDTRIERVLGDHRAYRTVLEQLQTAVAKGDRRNVASLVRYPFKAHTPTGVALIKNSTTFAERYAEIVSPAAAKAITNQRYADIFVSQNGLMVGSGEAWISGFCRDSSCTNVDVKVASIR